LNANWAHYMDPEHPKHDMKHQLHLAARRYTTHPEQQSAVTSVLKVVLQSMSLNRDVIKALDWSINEVTDNVLNHALSQSGGIVQASTFTERHQIQFVVADSGRGIPTAMRDAFPRIGNDGRAIREAVKAGVTSIPESGQGNGLWGSLEIGKCSHGTFKVTSGKAQLSCFVDERTGRYRQRLTEASDFPGTVVTLQMRTDVEFDFEQALNLTSAIPEPVLDVVSLTHSTSDGELTIRVADEGLGYGTRQAGVALRQKCLNLLNAEPGRRLVLDWSGIDLVASSFADEAIGKLFVELGPTAFASRVSHSSTEPVVRSLLDRAVLQRIAQTAQSGGMPPE